MSGLARTAALVLLADDDADLRGIYAEYLLLSGFAVVQAPNGHEALAVAGACRPDVIITDVQMPRMSGPQLARALRADPDLRNVPVIFLSGLDSIRYEAADAGSVAIATKPLAPESLVALVTRILATHRPDDELPDAQPVRVRSRLRRR